LRKYRAEGLNRGKKVDPEAKFILPTSHEVAIIVFVDMEIMSVRPSSVVKLCGVLCSFGVANLITSAEAQLTLQKVPPLTVEQAPAYPENLARYHYGAQVEAAPQSNPVRNLQLSSQTEDRNTAEAALLCDDPTVGYALPNGTASLLISLSKVENIDNISFLNQGAKGDVTIATSNAKLPPDSPQWRQVSKQELTGDNVKAKVGPSEAKYIKLTFNINEPGRIAALGVYSTPTVAAFTMPRARKSSVQDHSDTLALISYNLTNVHAKARALYVSSGEDLKQANNMIDDQPSTYYTFAGNDASPVAVIDLGKVTTLRRISALYSPQQGKVDFYVLQSLPGSSQERAPKTLTLNETEIANFQPVGSVADGSGRAAIDFPETTGRYIMVRWVPATQSDASFSVAEVAAFGGDKPSTLIAANTVGANEQRMTSDGKTMAEGKDFKDLGKEMPEETAPAEGPAPTLPDPPPFTFVPQIVPASP
jgi:hypothetical protein